MRPSRAVGMTAILAMAFACFSAVANGAEPAATPTIYGIGTKSCGDYLDARKSSDQALINLYGSWVDGFLTSGSFLYVMETKKPADFFDGTDLAGAMYWLENYCHAHPTVTFAIATLGFMSFRTSQMENSKAGSQ